MQGVCECCIRSYCILLAYMQGVCECCIRSYCILLAYMQGVCECCIRSYCILLAYMQGVCECWSLLKQLVDVPRLPPRAYEQRTQPMLQKAFVLQARHYLESR